MKATPLILHLQHARCRGIEALRRCCRYQFHNLVKQTVEFSNDKIGLVKCW
jgi:hypothetical protein